MRRRPALAVLASLVGVVSGCGTRLPPSARTPVSAVSTDTPAPDPLPLDELPCPPSDVNPETAVCPAERDDAPVAVRTNRPSVTLDDAGSVRFVLENAGDDELRFNPNNPEVYRFTDDDGYALVERRSSGNGVTRVPPNGTYSWRLTDLPQFDRLSVGAFMFAARVPTAGAMGADRVTCLSPFRLTAERG